MILDDPREAQKLAVKMHQAYQVADRPAGAQIDVTYRCDLDCQHCYLTEKERWPEMNTAELRGVLDQLYEMGAWRVVWSGGEVLLRPDFFSLLEYAAGQGMMNVVKSHVGNLTAAGARRLAEARVSRLDVSVYSLRDKVHDAVTRRSGSLRATLEGIDHALAAGLGVRVSVVVLRENLGELGELDDYFRSRGCVPQFTTNILSDQQGEGARDHLALALDELVQAKVTLLEMNRARGVVDPLVPMDAAAPPCSAARSWLYITPDGAVWPCVNFPMAMGHLREQSLETIWRSSPQRAAILAYYNRDRDRCEACAGNALCAYCMGQAFSRTGDFKRIPDSVHLSTRAVMEAYQQTGIHPFSPGEWRSVPLPDVADHESEGAPKKFVFPIYRPSRGRGRRVVSSSDRAVDSSLGLAVEVELDRGPRT